MGIETQIVEGKVFLEHIGAGLSLILIILGGIVYGISQGMPSETRGKWQSFAIGLVIGGIVMAAIIGGAELIHEISLKSLSSG